MRNQISKRTKLDLDRYLYGLRNEIYCIVKLPNDFPNCRRGSDLDIFCYRVHSFGKRLLELGQQDVRQQNLEIEISKMGAEHWHIDFLSQEMIEFRFDLYGTMPAYNNMRVKPALFESIIENAVTLSRAWSGWNYNVYVPATIDDMLIRYLEYCEYFKTGPDKIHHLDYIQSLLCREDLRIGFFEKLHHYVDIPHFDELSPFSKPTQSFKERVSSGFLKKSIYEFSQTPLPKWPAKIVRGVQRIYSSKI
jgi:hypothetical protein